MLATGELVGYECATCTDQQKLVRRCPYPGNDEAYLAEGRRHHPANPLASEACPLLKIKWHHHRLLRECQDYERGHLLVPGSLSEQPFWWVHGCREALYQVKLSHARLEKRKRPPMTGSQTGANRRR